MNGIINCGTQGECFTINQAERKQLMHDLSQAFVALPGGLGTLDEAFEALTWQQLGVHRKPVGLLDVEGYYASLLAWLARAGIEGFVPARLPEMLLVEGSAAALLDRLAAWTPPDVVPWVGPEET